MLGGAVCVRRRFSVRSSTSAHRSRGARDQRDRFHALTSLGHGQRPCLLPGMLRTHGLGTPGSRTGSVLIRSALIARVADRVVLDWALHPDSNEVRCITRIQNVSPGIIRRHGGPGRAGLVPRVPRGSRRGRRSDRLPAISTASERSTSIGELRAVLRHTRVASCSQRDRSRSTWRRGDRACGSRDRGRPSQKRRLSHAS